GFVLLDHRHFHAELRRADGADIAAGTGTDDNEIVKHRTTNPLRDGPDPQAPPSPALRTSPPRSLRRSGDRGRPRDTSVAVPRSCPRSPLAAPVSCACRGCRTAVR